MGLRPRILFRQPCNSQAAWQKVPLRPMAHPKREDSRTLPQRCRSRYQFDTRPQRSASPQSAGHARKHSTGAKAQCATVSIAFIHQVRLRVSLPGAGASRAEVGPSVEPSYRFRDFSYLSSIGIIAA